MPHHGWKNRITAGRSGTPSRCDNALRFLLSAEAIRSWCGHLARLEKLKVLTQCGQAFAAARHVGHIRFSVISLLWLGMFRSLCHYGVWGPQMLVRLGMFLLFYVSKISGKTKVFQADLQQAVGSCRSRWGSH